MNNKNKQISRLLIFAEVAKQGSFTAAAKELGVSKSAVSQQIQLLEQEIGLQLLNRTTRGLSLTAIGERMRFRCDTIQDQVNLVFTDLANAHSNPTGPFVITFPYSLESNVVVPAIKQLCIEYPGIQPELIASDEYQDLVTNHIDVAIRAGDLSDSNYRALPLGQLTEIFCATPLYLQRRGLNSTSFKVDDLSTSEWIAASWQKADMLIFEKKTKQQQVITLQQFAVANTLPSSLNLALSHLGIVLLPEIFARPYLHASELVQIVPTYSGPVWPLYSVHNYQHEKPIHLVRFHQLLKQLIANQSKHSQWVSTFALN